MNIAVAGAGKWGSALAHAYSFKNSVIIGSRRERNVKNFVQISEVMSSEYIVMAIPTQFVREFMDKHFKFSNQKILVAAKGIEVSSGKFLQDIYEEYLPQENIAYLSGPSFAAEVMKSLPTALVVSSTNLDLAKEWADAMPQFIKAYVDSDVVGAEVAGAYKNVIAIAAGVCDGLELGNNARAALTSRGLVEMTRFGKYFGAKSKTFLSLGGAGDLFLTASSPLSRNYRVGFGLAKEKSLNTILEELGEVAEGVVTTKAIVEIGKKEDIYLPIASEVNNLLNGKEPKSSLKDLLS